MLHFNKIDVFESFDANKTNASKEYNGCHNWYFLDKGLIKIKIICQIKIKFQPYVCDGCPNTLMMSTKLNDIAILNIRSVDYCCIINGIGKSKAINLLQNANMS